MATKRVIAEVPKTVHLEFGGVPGVIAMTVGLPAAVYLLNLACNVESCTILHLPYVPSLSALLNKEAAFIFLGWFAFQLLLYLLPTGRVVEGLPLSSGKQLKYRCNGFISFLITMAVFGGLIYWGYPVAIVYDKFLQLATAALIFSVIFSTLLYLKACLVPKDQLASGGNSGNMIYDFFMGHELNPRIGPIDLKFFCELRPGLIGWVILDLCFIAKACQLYEAPPAGLVVVCLFHICYVADALWFEDAVLSTMDIVHDGFGFMLVFGDLVWVPFLYSLQARFLLEHPQDSSPIFLAVCILLHVLGYTIFRSSNSEKNAFRKNPKDPKLAHLKTISTKSGRKLLVSSWWGMCRHPNYLGDLIMALSWSLPCGFQHILPYFYPIYFLGLLIHRFSRDDEICRKKYGPDWDRYCSLVKYKIFPYIY